MNGSVAKLTVFDGSFAATVPPLSPPLIPSASKHPPAHWRPVTRCKGCLVTGSYRQVMFDGDSGALAIPVNFLAADFVAGVFEYGS